MGVAEVLRATMEGIVEGEATGEDVVEEIGNLTVTTEDLINNHTEEMAMTVKMMTAVEGRREAGMANKMATGINNTNVGTMTAKMIAIAVIEGIRTTRGTHEIMTMVALEVDIVEAGEDPGVEAAVAIEEGMVDAIRLQIKLPTFSYIFTPLLYFRKFLLLIQVLYMLQSQF